MQHTPGGEHGAIAFFQQKSGSVDYVVRQRRCSSARATRKRLKTPSQTTIGMLLMRRIIRNAEDGNLFASTRAATGIVGVPRRGTRFPLGGAINDFRRLR